LERCAIDPSACPRDVRFSEVPHVHTSIESANKKGCLDKAAAIEAELATMTSDRHHLFFMFGFWLANGGLPEYEIESRLLMCAGPETKMQRQVPDILKSLEKYGLIGLG